MIYSGKIVFVLLAAVAICGCRGIRPDKGKRPVERVVLTTGYCKCGKCCGWKRNWYGRAVYAYGPNKGKRKIVGQTASGTKARMGVIAADAEYYPFGTVIYIDGYGYGRVEDRGGAVNGRDHIDLFFNSHKQAMRWGKQMKKVKIWFP